MEIVGNEVYEAENPKVIREARHFSDVRFTGKNERTIQRTRTQKKELNTELKKIKKELLKKEKEIEKIEKKQRELLKKVVS